MASTRLSISNLNKSYSTPVLTDITLTVARGEIHAIVGENGAGKTTLGSILAGFLNRDSGRILLDDIDYEPAGPKDAFNAGISCATQEFSLIDTLSVAENIALRKLPQNRSIILKGELEQQTRSLLRVVGLEHVSPDTKTETLGIAERQLVELAKALSMDYRVLILDEPTAALTSPQTAHLHKVITGLANSGTSVIYISHRLRDVLEVSDTVTVLRDGRIITTAPAKTLNLPRLIEYMSGHIPQENRKLPASTANRPPVLEVDRITTGELPHEISFTCCAGEVIGIAGLSGSGRSELLNALFGLTPLAGGRITRHTAKGKTEVRNPTMAITAGMGYLGEDRQSMGLFSGHSILTNMMVPGASNGITSLALLDYKREKYAGDELIGALGIKCQGLGQDIDQLSGGNQQKVLIARWLHCDSDILLFDEPTRGIDVSAKDTIYNLIHELRNKRKTILFTSSEIEELMLVSNRIFVLSDRKLVREFKPDNWSEAGILAASFSEFTTRVSGVTQGPEIR